MKTNEAKFLVKNCGWKYTDVVGILEKGDEYIDLNEPAYLKDRRIHKIEEMGVEE